MPDQETLTALTHLGDRLETKIDEVNKASESRHNRVQDRINEHEHHEGEVFREFTETLSALQTEIKIHSEQIIEARKDRKGLWKWFVGTSAASGTTGGFLAKLLGAAHEQATHDPGRVR